MGAISIRSRISRSRSLLPLVLIVGVGFLVALHHGEPMVSMDHGHEGGGTALEMAGSMICLGILAIGVALVPKLGGRFRFALLPRRGPRPSFLPRASKTPRDFARAGPAVLEVFRL